MQGARAPQPGATNRPSPSGHTIGPSAPDRSQARPSSSAVRPPGRPERLPALSQPAPQRPPGAGGPGGRGTPGPMPNPEVKPASAEGTAGATLWETRAPPAPGARCAGRGRGGANRAPGRGGPEGSPPFVCGRPPRFREEERPPAPSGAGGLFAFGAARFASPMSTCHAGNVAGGLLILSRTSSRGYSRSDLTLRARRGLLFIYRHPVCGGLLSHASVRRSSCCLIAARGACALFIS